MRRRRPQRGFLILLSLGAFLTSAILTGDLLVGTSVKKSLASYHQNKWGDVRFVISRETIPESLPERLSESAGIPAEGVLLINGRAVADLRQTEGVLFYGIDPTFFQLYPESDLNRTPQPGRVWINKTAAEDLDIGKGDALYISVPSVLRDLQTPLELEEPEITVLQLEVDRVLEDSGPGRLSESIDQQKHPVMFLNRRELAAAAGIPANRIFISGRDGLDEKDIEAILGSILRPEDIGLQLNETPKGLELTGNTVFLPERFIELVRNDYPETVVRRTSFLKEVSNEDLSVRFVFAGSAPDIDGAVLEDRLAEDLIIFPGSNLLLHHFRFDESSGLLSTAEDAVTVAFKAPLSELEETAGDIPPFPGLDESEDCADWSTLLPLDLSGVSQKEEESWDTYGRRPRILLPERQAAELGFPAVGLTLPVSEEELTEWIRSRRSASSWGYRLRPVYSIANSAAEHSMDFSSLFLSLSFFILAAVALLSGTLSRLFLARREPETRLLIDLGFSPQRIAMVRMKESGPYFLIGGLAGIPAGLLYLAGLLYGLRTIWQTTTGTDALQLYFDFPSLLTSIIAGPLLGGSVFLFSTLINIRKIGGVEKPKKPSRNFVLLSVAGVLLLTALTLPLLSSDPMLPLLCGTAAFAAVLLLIYAFFPGRKRINHGNVRRSATSLFLTKDRRNLLMLITVLASALFLNIAVTGNRMTVTAETDDNRSPTGGFRWIVSTERPVHPALSPLDSSEGIGLGISGTDRADCLNINFISRPALVGIPVETFSREDVFSQTEPEQGSVPWTHLEETFSDGTIPAFIDEGVLLWLIGGEVGDVLEYTDRYGNPVGIRIIGTTNDTVLQGFLMISEKNLQRFPDSEGLRLFLLPGNRIDSPAAQRIFSPFGATVTGTKELLQGYLELQNTYLRIFQLLSALALVIGAGSFILVLRTDLLKHKEELDLLNDLGFPRWRILAIFSVRYGATLAAAALAGLGGVIVFAWTGESQSIAALLGLYIRLSLLMLIPALTASLVPLTAGLFRKSPICHKNTIGMTSKEYGVGLPGGVE